MSENSYEFPDGFIWGAAAASYQIEGAVDADGKGRSDWDMFTEQPGAIFEGHSGRIACDHYHRFGEDVALMKQLGIHAYRLSLCWPRLFPDGVGSRNEKGFDFYDRLFDELLAAGITPWVTLFHWDYPLALLRRGGWMNPDSSDWFADYVAAVADRYSDRVRHFFTLNEPQVYIGFGMQEGRHAPGFQLPLAEVLQAGHHTLLAHGKAVLALRAGAKQPLTVAYAPVGMPKLPVSAAPEDIELARRATFEVTEENCWSNSWWMDPVYLGAYPDQALDFYGARAPRVAAGDMDIIRQRLDLFAVNIYQGQEVTADPRAPLGYRRVLPEVGGPRTAFDWPVTEEALYWGPRFFHERYNLPVIITENGLSCRDWVSADGRVHDPGRIDFTTRYLRKYHQASRDGVPLAGYFHWSIMDNFEWSAGYRERFGLIHVDYQTQKRTPKDSFYWYQQVIAGNGQRLVGPPVI